MTNETQNFKGERMLQRADELELDSNTKELPKDKQLLLLDNVQFIYELALAQPELQSLGAHFEVTNGLREFKLLKTKDEDELRRKLAYFKFVKGKPTDYFQIIQKNRTHSVNQYLTHWIYPYKWKFHPQMIRALLNIIGLEHDPFLGSGTTSLAAKNLNRNSIAYEINEEYVKLAEKRIKEI